MKALVIVLATLVSMTANAGNQITNFEAGIGAEMMIRQVLNKKLLGAQEKNVYADLERALEGSGKSGTRNDLTAITCDATLGTSVCEITVTGQTRNERGPKYSYTIVPNFYHGKMMRAAVNGDMNRTEMVIWEVAKEIPVGQLCPAQAIPNDQIAYQIGRHGGYVCYSCEVANGDLVVKGQTKCNNTISCESGVCE